MKVAPLQKLNLKLVLCQCLGMQSVRKPFSTEKTDECEMITQLRQASR